jgi:hypothetical protein
MHRHSVGVVAAMWLVGHAASAQSPARSCDDALAPARTVHGERVGPSSCLMHEHDVTSDGRRIRRIDVGLNGTVDGYLAKVGDYKEYFTNSPDLVFPQTWGPRQILFGVATYERDKGAAMTLLFPDRTAWNHKMFVMVHGRGVSFKDGGLKPWDRNADDLDKYDRLLLAKGYAVVKTHRSTVENVGEITAKVEDGTTVDYIAFNDTAHYVMDFTDVAKTMLASRLGGEITRTYFYGHSAGARIGHGLNYTPGLNVGRDGKRFFDGFLNDDPAAGTWYPVVIKDGKDVLLTSDADKAAFVPQIDVAHQMYNNIWPPKHPDWMSSSYLENKRNNAKILRDKGLISKYRMYEIRSISHSGGETLKGDRESQNLDLSRMMERFVDLLDAWVERGAAPPPTRSDWPELGVENPALAFPEVACPLGVYYSYPESTSGATAFAAFDGRGIEPLDGKKVFVDMNRNGVWDYRETATDAWRRLGLLQKAETLTTDRYVACVQRAAESLRKDGFFSDATAAGYVERARAWTP